VVRRFTETKQWPTLANKEILILYFRLSYGVDLARALSNSKVGIFSAMENRDSEMIFWALNEAWDYPGLAHTVRFLSENREVSDGDEIWN
jgi:hypothetical protein